MGSYPGLSGWAQCHHKGPYKGDAGGPESEGKCGDGSWKQRLGYCEATSQEMQAPLEAGKGKERILP